MSLGGFALGVAIAAPIYAARRWPEALSGTGLRGRPGVRVTLARLAATLCVVLGLPQLFWALGGTIGLNGATLDNRDAQWHLLTANNGLWALVAAWGVWTLTRHSRRAPLLPSWVSAGFLFAWGSWKAAFAFAVTPEFPPPEQPWMLTLQNHFSAVAGLLILVVVLMTVPDQAEWRPAVDEPSTVTCDEGEVVRTGEPPPGALQAEVFDDVEERISRRGRLSRSVSPQGSLPQRDGWIVVFRRPPPRWAMVQPMAEA